MPDRSSGTCVLARSHRRATTDGRLARPALYARHTGRGTDLEECDRRLARRRQRNRATVIGQPLYSRPPRLGAHPGPRQCPQRPGTVAATGTVADPARVRTELPRGIAVAIHADRSDIKPGHSGKP